MTKHTKPKKVESYETPVCRGKISLLQKKVTCQKQHRNQLVVRRMVLISTLYRRNLWGKSWWIFFLISSRWENKKIRILMDDGPWDAKI
ncbi:hypothetical protein JHK82_056628 [Glycine max]|uniref:Uncharacterized protein n=1 Tax=Glycine max TaxID=3847 RepID=A0A0R0EKT4_SOYBN|nr:hypothetical protein JHK86_056463 [Glycine max]KAG4910608.1 hypothetical protein JHK87_056724 [Glycine soja]KAG4919187.1 hypothetical protein JHK85_057468 [Glycine max]KAG5075267.1 hypothetical protein JHK84_056498 [Glycine max]KAG5077933.1 hypothetical protein JHK82_056628 [Glycine max]